MPVVSHGPAPALGEPGDELVSAACGIAADEGLPPARYFFGNWARASRAALMWSAAVFEPALPGLSRAATGSPVPPGPRSKKAVGGWWP